MEIGAVKQAFNNEIILLKKCLNQAKIQTIHKLTRKAKTFTEKKIPEPQKQKLIRKAESAVKEVLIIKKIKARDIARFIVTHKGKLNDFLNKPIVDNDKACARLLLHKALQEKYKHIREKFSNISIKDLFMSRQERKKLKKEAREKQKKKKNVKDKPGIVNVEGEWDVEMTEDKVKPLSRDDDAVSDDELTLKGNKLSNDDSDSDNNDNADSDDNDDNDDREDDDTGCKDESESEQSNVSESSESVEKLENGAKNNHLVLRKNDIDESDSELSDVLTTKSEIKLSTIKSSNSNIVVNKSTSLIKHDKKANANKNKNLNKKLEKRNFHKNSEESLNKVTKIADPFFITSTGENYMSLVEPRQPDEVKEVHKEGNRQYRRAVMFGHVPKVRPKRNDFEAKKNRFQKQNDFEMPLKKFNKFNEKQDYGLEDGKIDRRNNKNDSVPEKLHPSWEAKKKQSGILPFTGKKIVFDES